MTNETYTREFIECEAKTDKLGRTYYTEVWEEVTFTNEGCVQVSSKIIHKGRCTKQDFLDRMERTAYMTKTPTYILFAN